MNPGRRLIPTVQHRIAAALGVDEERRTHTVMAMLDNNRRRAPGYWIQLFLAMGIATFGLVLNSTAVVIGAMLVSPLMGPILEMGMGFAVGSPFLILRATLRVLMSIVVVVSCAALLTVMLPFHEVTSEIAARVAPTALDLLVAVFCALTAAYTTVRPASDTTSAAAGTAIGIALVPPLCTAGFGIGIGSLGIAGGAALLFTANLSAILVFAVASFLLLGFNQVDAGRLADAITGSDVTQTGRIATAAERRLMTALGSRYGFAMRVFVPLLFLAAVFVPLRRALTEVTWEVRTRDAIRTALGAEAPNAVQTVLSLERHKITLRLVIVGTVERAAELERLLISRIEARAGVTPLVTVTAVPDTRTLASAAAASATGPDPIPLEFGEAAQRIRAALEQSWPTTAAGQLLEWELLLSDAGPPQVLVRHVGQELGEAGRLLLAQALSVALGTHVDVRDVWLVPGVASAGLDDSGQWLRTAQPMLAWTAESRAIRACVRAPVDTTRHLTRSQRAVLDTLRASPLARVNRLVLHDSAGWSIQLARVPCFAGDSSATGSRPPA